MSKTQTDNLLMSWSEFDICDTEIDYRLENWQQWYHKKPTREFVQKQVWSDSDLITFTWEDFLTNLDEELKKISPDGYWQVEVHGFGWRQLNGQKMFEADNARKFLQEILPKTDCTFYIYKTATGLSINNFHHDSPVGKEWYYIKPLTWEQWNTEE